ncbi:MAG: O-antigen ligase family protein, partial [Candidatus Marinimicrobia bacterium]|nr:O-antigen ligase family protein [Candidatus Neomarinimicrobiota bacterium]
MARDGLLENRTNRIAVLITIPLSIVIAFILIRMAPAYALVAVLGVGVLIATFINTDFAIYTLIFSMLLSPEFGSRTTTGEGVTVRIDDIILAIIVFTWLAKTALYKELGIFKKTPLNKPISFYIFICFLSTGFGMMAGRVSILTGFFFVVKYIQFFFIYFMVVNHVRTKKQIDNFVIALLITFMIVVLISIAQIPTGRRLTAPFEGSGGEPNTLGGYLMLIVSINIGLLFIPGTLPKKSIRRALFGITMLSILPFLLTNSRTSWVSGIPVIISYIIFSKRRYIIIGFVIFLIIISPLVLPGTVTDRIKYTFTEQKGYARTLQEEIGGITLDTSSSERVRSWKRAFKELPQHPFLGFGVTGWQFLDAQFIRVLIETGFIGLGAFIYLLYSLIKSIWSIYKNAQILFFKALALGFFIATIAMITHSIGANTFIIIRIMEPFWLVCGLVLSI